MQNFAYVQDGIVIERIDLEDDIRPGIDLYTPEFASALISCGADVQQGWTYNGKKFLPPSDVTPTPTTAQL